MFFLYGGFFYFREGRKSPCALALVLVVLVGAAVHTPSLALLQAATVGHHEPSHLPIQGRISLVSEDSVTNGSLCLKICCRGTNSLLICKLHKW